MIGGGGLGFNAEQALCGKKEKVKIPEFETPGGQLSLYMLDDQINSNLILTSPWHNNICRKQTLICEFLSLKFENYMV